MNSFLSFRIIAIYMFFGNVRRAIKAKISSEDTPNIHKKSWDPRHVQVPLQGNSTILCLYSTIAIELRYQDQHFIEQNTPKSYNIGGHIGNGRL